MAWDALKALFKKAEPEKTDAEPVPPPAPDPPAATGAARDRARALLDAYEKESHTGRFLDKPRDRQAGKVLFESDDSDLLKDLVTLGFERQAKDWGWRREELLTALLARKLPWTAEELERLVAASARTPNLGLWPSLLRHLVRFAEGGGALTPDTLSLLREKRNAFSGQSGADATRVAVGIADLIGDESTAEPDAGDAWADRALADLAALPEDQRAAWRRLFAHLQTADGGKPSAAWRKETKAQLAALPDGAFPSLAVRWMEAVTLPVGVEQIGTFSGRTYANYEPRGSDRNITLLKGLAWAAVDFDRPDVARALGKMTEACLKKLPGVGPWGVRAASAAVWALSEMTGPEAAAVLARLKTRLTYRGTLTQVEKALEASAQRLGVTKPDLEDMSVPAYGLGEDGKRREEFGEYAAEMALTDDGITLTVFGPGGKVLKSPPAAFKQPEHADEWKALKADADAAAKTLSAQKQRFDGFALEGRVWPLSVWRERFLEHPLLASIARRLIWRIAEDGRTADVLWDGAAGSFIDSAGRAVPPFGDAAEVRLWHPVLSPVEEVVRWRGLLETRQIRQPFKQAHREVYLLTAAEENTRTYSNRFAGHILKQHQFAQLAAIRGWKNQLRLMVDDEYEPARRELPQHGIRAEFWVEGVGDNYGTDTNDTGTYLYLSTDQVRFYPLAAPANHAHAYGGGYDRGADPLPLTQIDPLVFSEILRDVDLFVGVASVGNDPNWFDGGPNGRHQGYWRDYAFGALSETAETRRDVLAKLLPRLKIRDRTTLDGRFLVVRGDLRTYKIHLGSGNILMEPNDQYLCIVQDRSAKGEATGDPLYLPFEGDSRLALILSKAMLLADDTKIADPTITRQIGGK